MLYNNCTLLIIRSICVQVSPRDVLVCILHYCVSSYHSLTLLSSHSYQQSMLPFLNFWLCNHIPNWISWNGNLILQLYRGAQGTKHDSFVPPWQALDDWAFLFAVELRQAYKNVLQPWAISRTLMEYWFMECKRERKCKKKWQDRADGICKGKW